MKSFSGWLAISLGATLVWQLWLLNQLAGVKPATGQLFISQLIGWQIHLPVWGWVGVSLINGLLIGLIGRRLVSAKAGIWASLIYGLTPWTGYLVVAQSVDILWLSWGLLGTWAVLELKSGRQWGWWVAIGAMVGFGFSSIFGLGLIGLWLGLAGDQLPKKRRFWLIWLGLVVIELGLIGWQPVGAKNIWTSQVTIFSNPGLVNAVNQNQGQLAKAGWGVIGRVFENRYLYLGQHLVYVSLNQLAPVYFFGPQMKLLNFSFSPPLWVGLVIPWVIGLGVWLKQPKWFLLFGILAIPSILAQYSPAMDRLVLELPLIILTIVWGLDWLSRRSQIGPKLLLVVMLGLIGWQLSLTLVDIPAREVVRMEMFDVR